MQQEGVILFTGKLNKDDSLAIMEQGDFIGGLNITRDQTVSLKDLVISNLRGNRILRTVPLPAGENKVIGAVENLSRNRVYYFIYNSEGVHRLEYFDFLNNQTTVLLEDNPLSPVLKLDPNERINDIHIINDDENGDLLFWNQPSIEPRVINITRAINGWYAVLRDEDISVIVAPPLLPPSVAYSTNGSIKGNSLKGKLFIFAYRYIYMDDEFSVLSPFSKVPMPPGGESSQGNYLLNNVINLTINTGSRRVKGIEVVYRESEGALFSNYKAINKIDKTASAIGDDDSFSYEFSNSGGSVTLAEDDLYLYDEVPRKALAQSLVDGRSLVYGGITEGYDGISPLETDIKVQVTYESVVPSSDNGNNEFPSLIIVSSPITGAGVYTFEVGSSVTNGDIFTLQYRSFEVLGGPVSYDFQTIASGGDNRDSIANALVSLLNATPRPSYYGTAIFLGNGQFSVSQNSFLGYFRGVAIPADTGSSSYSFIDRVWKGGGKYNLGVLYRDKNGRVIGNPVNNYSRTDVSSITNFSIDELSATGSAYNRPVLNVTLQHLPPLEAATASLIVTKNLVHKNYFQFVSSVLGEDADYIYIGRSFYDEYISENPDSTASFEISKGDFIRLLYGYDEIGWSGYGAYYSNILSLPISNPSVDYTPIGGSPIKCIKARKVNSGTILGYYNFSVFEVYRGYDGNEDVASLYYEIGSVYPCQMIDGVNYHEGQTPFSNPVYSVREGDTYIKVRPYEKKFLISDQNFYEFKVSPLNSYSRGYIADVNAKEIFDPVKIRWSDFYQVGTGINKIAKFYPNNFDIYNRSNGIIRKIDFLNSFIYIAQEYKIGYAPVNLNIINTASGEGSLAATQVFIGTLVYMEGEFGIGSVPESWASSLDSKFFVDNYRGHICKIMGNNVISISLINKINSWATTTLPKRQSQLTKIIGGFNNQLNQYVVSLSKEVRGDAIVVEDKGFQPIITNVQLSANISGICSSEVVKIYSGKTLAQGVQVYIDPKLEMTLNGYSFIVIGNDIYNLDPMTGIIGEITSFGCSLFIPFSAKVGANISLACSSPSLEYYSSTIFNVGVIVYEDIELYSPVVGYNYIVYDGIIYELNPTTGVVMSSLGYGCSSGIAGSYKLGNNIDDICSNEDTTLYSSVPFAEGVTMYLDDNLVNILLGYSFIVDSITSKIYEISSTTGVVGAFTSISCSTPPVENISIENSVPEASITYIDPSFYTGITFPVNAGFSVFGYGEYSGTIGIGVSVSGAPTDKVISIFKNGSLVEEHPVTGSAVIYASVSFTYSDTLYISLSYI